MKLVSVWMIAYNQEQYIGQAIESIVTQKVNFDFEIVIGEDCSPDNTRKICEEYAQKYPELIRLLPSDRNYGSLPNTLRTLEACNGKYIATCEGDDYWTDETKLQQQIDFLEANPDFSLCFTRVEVKDEMGWNLPANYFFPEPDKDVFTIQDFILSEMNIIPTPTLVFRNVLPKPFPDFWRQTIAGDIGLQLFTSDKGKAKLINKKMAVYRNHSGGISKSQEHIEKGNAVLMRFYTAFNEFTNYKYNATFRKRFLENARVHLIYGAKDKKGWQRVKHYFKRMPDYLKYSDKLNIKELLYYHYVLLFPAFLKKK